ncbi:MAG: hypothetical protein NTV94_01150, partial [Planctomycetota bacterium]|nr:hypothetical protein [Planctomycetota bacterium]
ALVAGSCISDAFGQMKRVDGYYAVVTAKGNLRCGDGDLFYKVGEVAPGAMLFVDGESPSYLQVSYPGNMSVFVKADEVEVQGGTVKLTKASKLKAFNQATGWSGSWKGVVATDLPVGTNLKLVEAVKDGETGPIVGYRVGAPEQARAFVEPRVTRRATDVEVAAFKGTPLPAKPAVVEPAKTQPAKTEPVKSDAPKTDAPMATDPTKTAAAGSDAPKPAIDLTQPVATPAATDGTKPAAAPGQPATDGQPTTLTQVTTPEAKPATEAPKVEAPKIVPVEVPPTPGYDLESTFARVWKEPIMSAEMDELVGAYDKAIEQLDGDSERLASQLKARRSALAMRIELRDKMRNQAEARAAIEAGRGKVAEQLKIAEDGRVYTMIGQLQASTVYDGQKLPLMYRVVSVGGVSPRTLGYLKDSKDFALLGKVGAVIGVIGEAQLDRSLMLNVISPVRVDVLKPKSEAEQAAPAQPAAPAAAPAQPAAAPGGN